LEIGIWVIGIWEIGIWEIDILEVDIWEVGILEVGIKTWQFSRGSEKKICDRFSSLPYLQIVLVRYQLTASCCRGSEFCNFGRRGNLSDYFVRKLYASRLTLWAAFK
jgi:hypothetical protein